MSNKLGWIPDIPDHRDFVYAAAPKAYPSMVNLNSQCPPVYDQRTLSSCVGNGVSMVCQFNAIRQKLKKSNIMPSRLFVYWNARAYEGTTNVDEGCQIRDAIKGVAKLGIPIASYWPYILKNVNVQPIPSAYKEGANHKAIQYARLENTNLNILKGCLAEGFPFVFGAAIYQSFMTPAVAESGQPNF
jgi:C1A family cysteine protease